MAVSEDRKFTKEQVYTLLEGAKGKTLGEVDLRPPEFVYPKENRNHPFSHLSQLLLGKNHVDDGLDHLLQLRQHSVSSARIPQHQSAGSLEQKTGIINLGNRSISRSEHRNLIHLFAIFVMIHIYFISISLIRNRFPHHQEDFIPLLQRRFTPTKLLIF